MQVLAFVAWFVYFASRSVSMASDILSFIDCEGTEIMVTQTIMVDSHLINVTMPACPGDEVHKDPVDLKDSLLARRSSIFLEKRGLFVDNAQKRAAEAVSASPSECTNPSICQCGQACSVACGNFNNDANPTVNDCQNLAAILRSFQTTIGATFIQGHAFPNPILVDFSTCRVGFGNLRTDGGLIEYCWDGLGDNVVSIINGCIAPHITTGGTCTPVNSPWQVGVAGLARS